MFLMFEPPSLQNKEYVDLNLGMTVWNTRSKAGCFTISKKPYFADNLIASTSRILLCINKIISNMIFHQVEYSFFFLFLPIYMLEGEVLMLASQSTWLSKQQLVTCSIQTSGIVPLSHTKGREKHKRNCDSES